jgi:hypothetical protein
MYLQRGHFDILEGNLNVIYSFTCDVFAMIYPDRRVAFQAVSKPVYARNGRYRDTIISGAAGYLWANGTNRQLVWKKEKKQHHCSTKVTY